MAKRRRSKQSTASPSQLYAAIIITIVFVVILFFMAVTAAPRTPRTSNPPALATGRQTARPQSTPRPTATRVRSQSSGGQSSNTRQCPDNCTEAKEMGVSAEFAAQCGLDRDGDGVACYGD